MYTDIVTNTTYLVAAKAIIKGKFIVFKKYTFFLKKVKKTNYEFNSLFQERKKARKGARRRRKHEHTDLPQAGFQSPVTRPGERAESTGPRTPGRTGTARGRGGSLPVRPQAPPSRSHPGGQFQQALVPRAEGPAPADPTLPPRPRRTPRPPP